jgi:hypothetical protein
MDQHGSREVVGRIDDEGYKEDEDIKKASSKLKMTRNPDLRQGKLLLEDASLLKIQFTFIGRLASMYSEISGRFLLPGMNRVQMLGLSDDSRTPDQIAAKKEELENFKRDSQEGVRALTMEVGLQFLVCEGNYLTGH